MVASRGTASMMNPLRCDAASNASVIARSVASVASRDVVSMGVYSADASSAAGGTPAVPATSRHTPSSSWGAPGEGGGGSREGRGVAVVSILAWRTCFTFEPDRDLMCLQGERRG